MTLPSLNGAELAVYAPMSNEDFEYLLHALLLLRPALTAMPPPQTESDPQEHPTPRAPLADNPKETNP